MIPSMCFVSRFCGTCLLPHQYLCMFFFFFRLPVGIFPFFFIYLFFFCCCSCDVTLFPSLFLQAFFVTHPLVYLYTVRISCLYICIFGLFVGLLSCFFVFVTTLVCFPSVCNCCRVFFCLFFCSMTGLPTWRSFRSHTSQCPREASMRTTGQSGECVARLCLPLLAFAFFCFFSFLTFFVLDFFFFFAFSFF